MILVYNILDYRLYDKRTVRAVSSIHKVTSTYDKVTSIYSMAAAADDVGNFSASSTVGNIRSFRMDNPTPSNVRLFGGDVGNFYSSGGDSTNVQGSVPSGKRTDQSNISLDESLMFHIEMPIPVDDDMVPTLYQGDDDVNWVVSRKDDDDDVWGDCGDCGAVHLRNADCPTPEYSDDPRTYENWKFWRPTTPPLPSKSEFYAGAAQSPQDMDTNNTTTNTIDDFPENMPPKVVSIIKEGLNGMSYTEWKQSAKTTMKAMYQTSQARRRAIARDLALCDAERRYRERTEGPTYEEAQ